MVPSSNLDLSLFLSKAVLLQAAAEGGRTAAAALPAAGDALVLQQRCCHGFAPVYMRSEAGSLLPSVAFARTERNYACHCLLFVFPKQK